MSNEELAQLIHDGNGERQLELWERIKRYAMKTANRWLRAFPLRCDVEFDDLMSAAYIAMCEAASTYKAERGAFTTWYSYHLKTAYAALYGLRTRRAANDPLNNAVSLSTPIDEDITLEDAVPDPNGAESALRTMYTGSSCTTRCARLWRPYLANAATLYAGDTLTVRP